MPKIEEILNKLGNAKYLTKVDLTKGFWQIPLDESAKEKSAFVTQFGQYQFNVMPFGKINSGASFVRLMKLVLRGMEEFSDSFIDDIIIFSATFTDHLGNLEKLFSALREAKLTARPSKCQLAYPEIEYLAHTVGKGKSAAHIG